MNIIIILLLDLPYTLAETERGYSDDLIMFMWVLLGVGIPFLIWRLFAHYQRKKENREFSEYSNYINIAENSAGVVFWSWDIDYGCFYLQGILAGKKYSFESAYAFDLEHILEFVVDTDAARITSLFRECHDRGGMKIDNICRVYMDRERSGSVRTWRIIGDKDSTCNKSNHRMCGMLQDVTEWMQSEDARRKSEEEYRFLVQNANCIILRFNAEGIITYFNEYAEQFFGYSATEIIGRHVMGTIVPEMDSQGMHMRPLLMDIANNPHQYENNLNENRKKDGTRVWIAWTNKAFCSESQQGGEGVNEVLSIGIDVTSRREMEESLRRSEGLKEVILESITEGIAYINPDMTIGWINSVASEMAGIPRRQAIGRKCHDVFQDLSRECMNCPVRKAISTHKTQAYIGRAIRKYWLEITVVPVIEGNNVTGIVETFVDISERMRHQQSQINQQRLETLGQLAGGLAYDLRNHVNGIIGYCGMLTKSELGDEQRRMVELIRRSGKKCNELNRQLLAFESLDHSRFEPVDLTPLVKHAAMVAKEALHDKECPVTAEVIDNGTLQVNGERDQLESMLLSLVFHCRNNLQKKSSLVIRAELFDANDPVVVADEEELPAGKYVRVEFGFSAGADSDENYRYDNIFSNNIISARKNLGLAGAYGVARSHDGNITVMTNHAGGSLIQIYLPLWSGEADKEDKHEKSGEYCGQKLASVLIIDDDPVNRLLLQEALTRYGIVADLASEGKHGCNIYDPQKHELVFLDMVMPRMNGTETFDALVKKHPQVKVILISGFSVENEISALLLKGALGVLSKPFDISEIESMVEKMFIGRMIK